MSVDTLGAFRINVKHRAFGRKFVVTLEHVPSGRVLWKDKTVHLYRAKRKRVILRDVRALLNQRPLSVQAAVATNELKALVDECWREVCAHD